MRRRGRSGEMGAAELPGQGRLFARVGALVRQQGGCFAGVFRKQVECRARTATGFKTGAKFYRWDVWGSGSSWLRPAERELAASRPLARMAGLPCRCPGVSERPRFAASNSPALAPLALNRPERLQQRDLRRRHASSPGEREVSDDVLVGASGVWAAGETPPMTASEPCVTGERCGVRGSLSSWARRRWMATREDGPS